MAYSAETVQKVWEKGATVASYDPAEWRKDACGAWIARSQYGNRESIYGWEIDHITPTAHGGTDALSNLRPLQWGNNAAKQEGRLKCVVVAQGNKNVRKST